MMTSQVKTYLALGDSMSIDLYTGVPGGGAVSQFHHWLGFTWKLINRTADMSCIQHVPKDVHGDLITLTIGGNNLLADQERYLREGLDSFARDHLGLLQRLRTDNPDAFLIVGNVYTPQTPLPDPLTKALDQANAIIARNVETIGGHLADIREAFRGHETEYLCYDIEPSLKGASVIAGLFKNAFATVGRG
jgi:lysophospholipase L1-like esterase